MQGRLENELKKDKKIQSILATLPPQLAGWNDSLEVADKTPDTRLDYLRKVRAFLETVEKIPRNYDLTKLNTDTIIHFLKGIRVKEKVINNQVVTTQTSDSYKMTYWYCLNSLCRYLLQIGILNHNPMENIGKPKNHDLERINEHRVLLTLEDFKKILTEIDYDTSQIMCNGTVYLNNRDKAIMLMFMTTGMRKTALTEINIDDIDMESSTLYVIDKGDKPHQYVLNDELREALSLWLEDRNRVLNYTGKDTNALFVSAKGSRISGDAVSDIVKKYTQKALGKALSPHKLRSGFCSIMYSKTHDVEFVRRAVGHSNVATTQRYIVTDRDEKKRSAQIMSDLLGEVKEI